MGEIIQICKFMDGHSNSIDIIAKKAAALRADAENLSNKIMEYIEIQSEATAYDDSFIQLLTIFILSSIVGYFVVWKVTPALHTPLMSITNAISGIIIIGALLTIGVEDLGFSSFFSIIAIFLASVNIFGGFLVTYRIISMFDRR
ncbi:MAG: proton-translocating transhydrogenase family protein [Rickettsiaceae bacterium]|nr:proton-translocating transhydrogenase family protein [Rickettsiaceae bacterium]